MHLPEYALTEKQDMRDGSKVPIRVFHIGELVKRGWAASKFLTRASKVNMMPNGEHQIISPDRSQTF